jgi:hypothetical protein
MADRMASATITQRNAVPNTKAISSSVLMLTILGLKCPGRALRTHIYAA